MSPNAKFKSWYEYHLIQEDKLIKILYSEPTVLRCYCEPVIYDSDDADAIAEPCYCQHIKPDKVLFEHNNWNKPGYEINMRTLFGDLLLITNDTKIVKKHKVCKMI